MSWSNCRVTDLQIYYLFKWLTNKLTYLLDGLIFWLLGNLTTLSLILQVANWLVDRTFAEHFASYHSKWPYFVLFHLSFIVCFLFPLSGNILWQLTSKQHHFHSCQLTNKPINSIESDSSLTNTMKNTTYCSIITIISSFLTK